MDSTLQPCCWPWARQWVALPTRQRATWAPSDALDAKVQALKALGAARGIEIRDVRFALDVDAELDGAEPPRARCTAGPANATRAGVAMTMEATAPTCEQALEMLADAVRASARND
jgi:hypothetical protein